MTNYKEILKLKAMLEEANIPFYFTDDLFKKAGRKKYYKDHNLLDEFEKQKLAYQIILYSKDESHTRLCDAIEHCFSHGHENDLLEIMGGLTEEESKEDSTAGWLTAEDVFKRFKYCYENNTTIYNYKEKSNKSKDKIIQDIFRTVIPDLIDPNLKLK